MDKDYRFEVYTEYSGNKDKVFVVKYFDLDNVIGVGDTIEEAISEAKENLEVYLDYCKENNIIIPEPTTHDELDYSGKITVRMPKSLHKLVDERAQKEGVSINLLINDAISQYVSNANMSDYFVKKSFKNAIDKSYVYSNFIEQLEVNLSKDDFVQNGFNIVKGSDYGKC